MKVPEIGIENCNSPSRGVDHGEIKRRIYYSSDLQNDKDDKKVEYWTKDPTFEFMQVLQGIMNGSSVYQK
jgi:hypothetical protein